MSPLDKTAASEPAQYWRSLEDLAETAAFQEFVENEFPSLAEGVLKGPPATRRGFLKIMGSTLALAGMGGLTGCFRWPKENIVPFTRRPEGRIPGDPVFYATSMEQGGVSFPFLATSRDGRPTKLDGNPEHPASLGASNSQHQSSVLELYEPERLQAVMHRKEDPTQKNDDGTAAVTYEPSSWATALGGGLGQIVARVGQARGARFAVLAPSSSSPSQAAVRARLVQALPQSQWFEYDAVSRDNEREGAKLAFGRPYRAQLDFSRAKVILSLDSDFLSTHPDSIRNTREFSRRRRGENMNQLHVVEAQVTTTGTMADHRYPVRPAQVPAVAAHIAHLLVGKGLNLGAAGELGAFANLADVSEATAAHLKQLAGELWKHRSEALVVVGPRQPAEVHALAHAMNASLGSAGKTVTYTLDPDGSDRPSHAEAVSALTSSLGSGIDTLLILGGNPVYDGPADVNFAAALSGVTSMHLVTRPNETSAACTWQLPDCHFLEAWGDGRTWDGTYSLVQPLIAPLYDGKSALEILALFAGWTEPDTADATRTVPVSGHDIVRDTFRRTVAGGADADERWKRAIHDGFVSNARWRTETPAVRGGWGTRLARHASSAGVLPAGQFELVLPEDYNIHDGRYYENAWLQELPDPVTKLSWDNAAQVSPNTAVALGVTREFRQSRDTHYLLEVTVGSVALTVPAFVVPGHADGAITIPLGYRSPSEDGFTIKSYLRSSAGGGFNSYVFRSRAACQGSPVIATVRKTSGTYDLATTQDHHAVRLVNKPDDVPGKEEARRVQELVRVRDINHHEEHHGHAGFGDESLWESHKHLGENEYHRWAMAIDLSACNGCNACVSACQAENNIAVVGKAEAAYGREMHWLRIDRYFAGDPTHPESIGVVHQPMPCQQCENAPCEQVCPVGATMHSRDGLNDMVYNRCIGTRYCANNCPFKVRRFNYFNNYKHVDDVQQMVYNPEVTIRNRGVMEKCTYCVQRISRAKIESRNDGTPIPDDSFTSACAQACPAEAITFGDLNDPDSKVSKAKKSERNYTLLDELAVKPRTSYLERLKNRMTGGHS